jgi:hypothetical protein
MSRIVYAIDTFERRRSREKGIMSNLKLLIFMVNSGAWGTVRVYALPSLTAPRWL